MATFKKAATTQQRWRNFGCRKSVAVSLVVSVIAPLLFLAGRAGSFTSAFGHKEFTTDWASTLSHSESTRKLSALEQNFPQEALKAASTDPEPLNLNIVGQDLSSSLIQEETIDVSRTDATSYQQEDPAEHTADKLEEQKLALRTSSSEEQRDTPDNSVVGGQHDGPQLLQVKVSDSGADQIGKEESNAKENPVPEPNRRKEKKGSIHDSLIRALRDQLIMGKAYATLAQAQNNLRLLQELKVQTKEIQEILLEAETDSELPNSARSKIKYMGEILERAKAQHYDCTAMVKKLRAMLHATEQEGRMLKKQSVFLSQLAAKTIPKGLHCLSMRLSVEFYSLPPERRELPHQENLEDPNLYHYALFSDNVLATSVVINSTVSTAKDPRRHVFHLVTDKLNYGAMKMWFLANPPKGATVEVQNIGDFKWLNSSYCPVLRQLESVTMKEYYFRSNNPSVATGLKYRNPKYLSMLNHLRFYLPEIYPKLDKILFLDDDIVVQKDLTPLWSINLRGNVNGAVETCGASFHRFDKYLNFSNPLISKSFDPNACGWAYGMNIFDLRQWRDRDITGIYHRWQDMNEDRTLWKLGTLPPGLITFYNLTYSLNKHWHVLGLGYNSEVKSKDIHSAAVIHYNGNMKPWLEIGMAKYKHYWSRHVMFDHPYLQQCNINE
ncbi:polygalacturonate 4-alpha-galacturonosyltransferase [Selaginella moellendorffii]|uniref:polygalacturonate 4-alpha-galacturonosyltransferase n=1 Tax=Selaginella moellendorffii TaxID=88036 RepID=UPI000D1D0074|nr:polygalacturonate 4-alpha-galacturonosyltransferase [Selaginella moellendorffii]|eukprot:XP_024528428.1 polygalacturonate 4-alpha-galacturonosyltransferase [Selaginella moellendorffii]